MSSFVGRMRVEEGGSQMLLKILGVALAIWIVISVLGAVFKFLGVALVIGAVLFVGAAAYTAIKNKNNKALPR